MPASESGDETHAQTHAQARPPRTVGKRSELLKKLTVQCFASFFALPHYQADHFIRVYPAWAHTKYLDRSKGLHYLRHLRARRGPARPGTLSDNQIQLYAHAPRNYKRGISAPHTYVRPSHCIALHCIALHTRTDTRTRRQSRRAAS